MRFFRRLFLVLLIVGMVNALGFAYAHLARYAQELQNPFGSGVQEPAPIGALYAEYAQGIARGDLGMMPVGTEPITPVLLAALGASAGLLAAALSLSLTLGLTLGLMAVRPQSAQVAGWFTPIATLGLALPSFYLGTLATVAALAVLLNGWGEWPLPVAGFGWDAHLILPTLALAVRPTAQIAQATATLLAGEMSQQYIVTARSVGNTWRAIRWKHALRNVLAPILLVMASTTRLSLGELVVVEWLFNWPGVGRLLAFTLVPPLVAGPSGFLGAPTYFLNPPLLAILVTLFAALLLLIDALAAALARAVDPRLQQAEREADHD